MPASPRPNKKAMEIAYKILKTPKEQRQVDQKRPPEKTIKAWRIDSSVAQ